MKQWSPLLSIWTHLWKIILIGWLLNSAFKIKCRMLNGLKLCNIWINRITISFYLDMPLQHDILRHLVRWYCKTVVDSPSTLLSLWCAHQRRYVEVCSIDYERLESAYFILMPFKQYSMDSLVWCMDNFIFCIIGSWNHVGCFPGYFHVCILIKFLPNSCFVVWALDAMFGYVFSSSVVEICLAICEI